MGNRANWSSMKIYINDIKKRLKRKRKEMKDVWNIRDVQDMKMSWNMTFTFLSRVSQKGHLFFIFLSHLSHVWALNEVSVKTLLKIIIVDSFKASNGFLF